MGGKMNDEGYLGQRPLPPFALGAREGEVIHITYGYLDFVGVFV